MESYQIWIICISAGIVQVGSCIGLFLWLKKSEKNEIEIPEKNLALPIEDQKNKISKVDPIQFIP